MPIYIEVLKNNVTAAIIPFESSGNGTYSSLYMVVGMQEYDFVYSPQLNKSDAVIIWQLIFRTLNAQKIYLTFMREDSLFFEALNELNEYNISVKPYENVNICVGENYEDYYSQLSKHQRQNIRTAYNRLTRDGKAYTLKIIRGKPLTQSFLNKLIKIYRDRRNTRYHVKTSKLKMLYFKYYDFSTVFQQKYNDNLYAVLYIENKVAAFLSGVIDINGERLIVPRLTCVESFEKYSPGILLINELAKQFADSLKIKDLDLSKGLDNYKLTMGGKIYNSYNVFIALNK